MILAICVVVDESKCLDTPILELLIICEHLPFSLGRCANRHHKKNKLVVECKGFEWHPCFFSMGWMGVGINDPCNAMRTTCAQDNLMPACGSPSICNLGVVRRRSFTAAAPEAAILAQSLSDGTLLTRVVCETAGCDFLFVVPLRLRSFDGSASPQCSKLVFSSQLSSLPVEINLTDPDGFSDDMSEDLASFPDNVPLPPAPSCFVSDGHFASSGPLSRCVLQCCSLPIHLQCVTDLVHESSQSAVCPACKLG